MASLIGNDSNVKFSNINQSQILTNTKIGASPYIIDENGNITNNSPIINAIDIDWNNATADDITTPIKTTADLIALLSTNKINIRLNNASIGNLRSTVLNLQNTVNDLSNRIDSPEELQQIKIQLATAIDDINNLESAVSDLQSSNTNIGDTIVRLSNTLTNVKNSVPKYVSDLQDGYDVLRRSTFESIKDELKGESAFDVVKQMALDNGESFNYANEREWVASLKGEKGNTGASAYDIARQTALILGKPFPYNNEQEWITDIENGTEAKRYTDEQIVNVNASVDSKIVNAIAEVIDEAPSSYDTLREIASWIEAHPEDTAAMNRSINDLKTDVKNLLGNVTEEVEDPETHDIITRIKKFTNSSGSLNGEDWATSLEDINDLLNRVSFAANVQDNAEANKIDEVDFTYQDASELTGSSDDTEVKFGISSLNDKNVGISVNIDLIKKIQDRTLTIAENNANQKITTALNNAKTYTDNKLSWVIM